MSHHTQTEMGQIAFLGSGETAYAGGRLFEALAKNLSQPLHIAILETPAGFEVNSDQVAGRVGDFIQNRLQNYKPQVSVIPARKRGTDFSPDNPEILKPMLDANLLYMGAGSPSYAVRQLKDSLAWHILRARHRMGATLVFASAAVVSVGASALPVYEIYKVGEDVHVKPGLDFFASFGLNLTFVPHWNNAEGGEDVDTSRCFVGVDRFEAWRAMLPQDQVVVGLDEHTGLIWDMASGTCRVSGVGSVTIMRQDGTQVFPNDSKFDIEQLGECCNWPEPQDDIPTEVWELVEGASHATEADSALPDEVLALAEQRQQARADQDWAAADELRDKIAALGWSVKDTPDGPQLEKS